MKPRSNPPLYVVGGRAHAKRGLARAVPHPALAWLHLTEEQKRERVLASVRAARERLKALRAQLELFE